MTCGGISNHPSAMSNSSRLGWAKNWAVFCLVLLGAVAVGAAGQDRGTAQPVQANREPFEVRFGTVGGYLADVKSEDALAAFKIYASTISRQRGINGAATGRFFDDLQALRQALRAQEVDVAGFQTQDYFAAEGDATLDLMFMGELNNRIATEYVLLVPAEAKITDLRDLRNGRLVELVGVKMGLARIWLDVLLMEKGLPSAVDFFGSIRGEPKPTRAILPVFFHQAEACLVTREGYEAMAEMNPKIGQVLRVFASSPGIVPLVTCFRKGFAGGHREVTVSGYLEAHLNADGKQVLTLFKVDRNVRCQPKDLDTARRLVAQHDALKGTKRTGSVPQPTAVDLAMKPRPRLDLARDLDLALTAEIKITSKSGESALPRSKSMPVKAGVREERQPSSLYTSPRRLFSPNGAATQSPGLVRLRTYPGFVNTKLFNPKGVAAQ